MRARLALALQWRLVTVDPAQVRFRVEHVLPPPGDSLRAFRRVYSLTIGEERYELTHAVYWAAQSFQQRLRPISLWERALRLVGRVYTHVMAQPVTGDTPWLKP